MTIHRWPDVEILAAQDLPASGNPVDSTLEEIGRFSAVVLYCQYVADGGSTGAQARLTLFWQGGDDELYQAVDTNGTTFELQVRDLPSVAAGVTQRFAVRVDNPGGHILVVRANEQGDQANPGNLSIRAGVLAQ